MKKMNFPCKKGRFITFEGMEGCGKSTQIRLLAEALTARRLAVEVSRSPGGTPVAEKIRTLLKVRTEGDELTPEAELLLFGACHAQMTRRLILPVLERGGILLSDRFFDSTTAYQGYARGLGMEYISNINANVIKNYLPDYTIFMNISSEQAFLRKGGADKGDRLEQMGSEFHKKVYEGYLKLADMYPERIIPIDCSGTKYETSAIIINVLKQKGIIK